jgi:hypothetical protein
LIGSVSDVESVIPKITNILYTKKSNNPFFCYRYTEYKK